MECGDERDRVAGRAQAQMVERGIGRIDPELTDKLPPLIASDKPRADCSPQPQSTLD